MTAVSIIVCTHNRRELLPRCLESLVTDTSSVDRELLVVDNASTDGTSEYLQEFTSEFLQEFTSEFLQEIVASSSVLFTSLSPSQ